MARSSYWSVVNAAREAFDVPLYVAREFYAAFSDALTERGYRDDHAYGVDLNKHPRIAQRVMDGLLEEADIEETRESRRRRADYDYDDDYDYGYEYEVTVYYEEA